MAPTEPEGHARPRMADSVPLPIRPPADERLLYGRIEHNLDGLAVSVGHYLQRRPGDNRPVVTVDVTNDLL